MNDGCDLYQHVKRPEWGLSTIIAIDEDRTTFCFVDGEKRTISRDHIHLMERVLLVDATTEAAQKKLATAAKVNTRAAKPKSAAKKKARPSVSPT